MPRNGFTLVELMVVIAVMALLAGAVVVTGSGRGSGPAADASRFAGRLAAARDEAVVGGRPISAWVAPSGYGFERYQGGAWQAISEKPFEGDDWEGGTAIAMSGRARARVRFDSLGLPDGPTSFALSRGGQTIRVRVAANGDVSVG
jgi:general secretion pathway protein H